MGRRTSRAFLALALVAVACRTAAPPSVVPLPDPLLAPIAGPPLDAGATKTARAALAAARRGDSAGALRRIARLPTAHPVRRLLDLEVRFARGEEVSSETTAFARDTQGYAAAWELAAAAAQRAGNLEDALTAARELAALRSSEAVTALVGGLEGAVVREGVGEASVLLSRGDAASALARARKLLELVPTADSPRLLAVRAALALGEPARAAELIPALPDTPEGLELQGRVAEALQQWELALSLYQRLPEDHPGRCELLQGARQQWRLSLAPPQMTRALAAKVLSRRGLAAIVAWEVPAALEKAAGPVPVFEDVVGLPEGGDIVLLSRAGVLPGDSIARRFNPNRALSRRELAATVERLCRALGKPAPNWCEGSKQGECIVRPTELDGRAVAELVRAAAGEGEAPCSPR